MAYQIDYAYTCHTGKVRTNNEDNFWCCGVRLPVHNQGVDGILAGHTQHWQLPVLAVFDGMGGESCGEMAASAAVEALGGFYEENKKSLKKEPVVFLTGACANMNEAVCRTAGKIVSAAWELRWHFCLSVKKRSMPVILGTVVFTAIFRENCSRYLRIM